MIEIKATHDIIYATKLNLIMQTTLLFNFDVLISLVTILPKRIQGPSNLNSSLD